MDDDELKKLEEQYLGGGSLTITNLDDFDINAYLQRIENPIRRSDIDAIDADGINDFDLDNFRLSNEYNMESIDRMLAELDISPQTIKRDTHNPDDDIMRKYSLQVQEQESKSRIAMQEEVATIKSRDLGSSVHIKTSEERPNLLFIPSNEELRIHETKSLSGFDKPETGYRKASGATEVQLNRTELQERVEQQSPESSPLLQRTTRGATTLGKMMESFNLEPVPNEAGKKSVDNFKLSETIQSPQFSKQSPRIKVLTEEEAWMDEISKKIRYGEVDNLYQKSKIDTKQIQSMAESKNRAVRTRGKISIDKVKEYRLADASTSNFKQAMNKFDEEESKHIRDIRKKRNTPIFSALQNATYDITSMSSVVFDKGNFLQDLIKSSTTSSLSCFAYSRDNTSLFLAGTDSGDLLEIDLMTKKGRKQNFGCRILSVDISPDNEKMAVGLATGEIIVKKTRGSWISKRQKIEDKGIILLKFITNETIVASTDTTVLRLAVKDLKVMLDISKYFIIRESKEVIVQITAKSIDGEIKLIVATLEKIHLFLINNDICEGICYLERPEYIKEGMVPHVSWISVQETASHYAIVFWGNFVLLMKEEGINSFFGGMKQLSRNIIWGCVIRSRVVCLIFEDMEVNFESIQNVFANLISGGGFETKFKLTKVEYSSRARNICVNSDGNISKSWSEVIKSYDNNIYLLKNDSIFQIYYSSLLEMVRASSDRGEWIQAFKLCAEVCSGDIISSKEEKDTMRKEASSLAIQYIEKFLDKTRKGEEMHGKITRICIDTMIATQNEEDLFDKTRKKIDEISFWREIEVFIEAGLISNVPLPAIKEGGIYLLSESLQHIVFQYKLQTLIENEDEFNQLLMMLKRRKLWASLYKLGVLIPDPSLGLVLSSMLAELMTVSNNENMSPIKRKIESIDFCSETAASEFFEEKQNSAYFRIFWYLHKLVTWNVNPFYDSVHPKEDLWVKVIEWIIEPANLKVLSTVNVSLFLELMFELFLNVDFTSSEKVAECLRLKVNQFKEALHDPSTEQWTDENQGSYIFKSSLQILYKFMDPEYNIDVAFLAVKLITLSVFTGILDDQFTVSHTIVTLLSRQFVGDRLWFHYESISKEDLEEQVIRMISSWKSTGMTKADAEQIEVNSRENLYFRVMCHMIELRAGPIESLNNYIKHVRYGNSTYLFNWIKKKLHELKPETLRIEFSKSIITHLRYLINKNKAKAKEIIAMIPNVGVEAIESLK